MYDRDKQWTGLGLDWIRIITNYFDFGLDPDVKRKKIRIRTGFGLV